MDGGRGNSAWDKFLASYRRQHPSVRGKDVMRNASKLYKKMTPKVKSTKKVRKVKKTTTKRVYNKKNTLQNLFKTPKPRKTGTKKNKIKK